MTQPRSHRTHRAQSALLVTFAWGLFSACGTVLLLKPDGGAKQDGGTKTDAGVDAGMPRPDGGLPVALACETLNWRRCEYLSRCGLIGSDAASVNRCLTAMNATWCGPTTWLPRVSPLVNTLRYDAARAQVCADSFPTRACGEWETLPDSCTSFLLPNAGQTQSCYDGYQECLEGVCRGAACPRTCQPKGVTTDVCRVDSDCRSGLFCRPSTTTPGIGACTAFAVAEEACDSNTRCSENLWCVMNVCRRLPQAGDACLLNRCDDYAWCMSDADGGVCAPRKNRGAACSPGQCLPDLVCGSMTGVCEPVQLTQPGSPCTAQQRCPAGTVCVGLTANTPGLCQMPVGLGGGCVTSDDCRADLACLQGDGGLECGPRRAPGDECSTPRDCQAWNTCLARRCVQMPMLGEACGATRECRTGTCLLVPDSDAGYLCAPLLGPGTTCQSNAQCESGRCESGMCLASCTP